jgi:hypothetical protein
MQDGAAPFTGLGQPARAPDEPSAAAPEPAPASAPQQAPPEPPVRPDPAPVAQAPAAVLNPLPEWRKAPRPSAAVAARARAVEEAPHARRLGRSRAGRWALLLLVWLLAAGAGFALALFTLGLPERGPGPVAERPPDAAPAPEAPPAGIGPTAAPQVTRPPVAPALASTPRPSVEELIGSPLEATEPPLVPLPGGRGPPADPDLAIGPASPPPLPRTRPAAESVLPGQTRIFVHHPAGAADAGARARALAQQLRRQGAGLVEVRPVPFGIGSAGVRYFHTADRTAAVQLLRLVRSTGAAGGGRAPEAPGDFSYFRPSPSPGTLEVWLPGAPP